MIKEAIKEQKPIKCTLTRIENEFSNSETYKHNYVNILKNYVYIPEKKKIIA